MTEHEKRQRALGWVIGIVQDSARQGDEDFQKRAEQPLKKLRNCVAIQHAEYDMLRRALWKIMFYAGFPNVISPVDPIFRKHLLEAGMIIEQAILFTWTPAAHVFAKEMKALHAREMEGK